MATLRTALFDLRALVERGEASFQGKVGIWRTTAGGTHIFIPDDGSSPVMPKQGPDLKLKSTSGGGDKADQKAKAKADQKPKSEPAKTEPKAEPKEKPKAKDAGKSLAPTLVPTKHAARVGVPGSMVLPPPGVPRLPNSSEEEQAFEEAFATAFEADPDKMASAFAELAAGQNHVFETDGAKALMHDWQRPDLPADEKGKPINPERAKVRSRYNTALHQTANAIAKRAFIQRLDDVAKMPEDKRKILVTSGGVASGKGVALGARPDLPAGVAATWDAAGEQNGTENDWVMAEAKKRGIRPTFLFVHAEPEARWKGAVERAKSVGRMVDARLFADSYAEGARNFAEFKAKNKDDADFVIAELDFPAGGKPTVKMSDEVPEAATQLDADKLYASSLAHIDREHKAGNISDDIHAGATAGRRIWKSHA